MLSETGGVFDVTAFDPDAVQHVLETTPYQEVKVYSSIVSIKPSDLKSKFIFTEKETIRAMMIVGATTNDLIMMSENEKRKIPGTPQIRRKIIEELEERRMKIFTSIVEARNNLIQKSTTISPIKNNIKSKIGLKSSLNKTSDNLEYNRMKQKQLNSLISCQAMKNKMRKSDEAASIRLKELRKIKAMEMQKKQAEEHKRMRTFFLNSIKKNSGQDINGDKNEFRQFKKEREDEIQKEKNELMKLEQSLSNTPKKLQKEKKAQIESLKAKILENEAKLSMSPEKTKDNNSIFDQYSLPNTTNAMMNFRKKEEMKLFMQKEKEKMLYDEKTKLEKKLSEKDARIEANLKLISSQKMKHIHENQIILRKRSQSAAATKKILEQQRLEKLQKAFDRQEKAIERINELKTSKTASLLEKAGQNWIKQKNGNDNAKKISIQRRYKAIERVEKTIERQEEIQNMKNKAEQEKIKRYRAETIKKVQQRKEYDELKNEVLFNPEADPLKLAEKYKIDMNAVEKMQEEIKITFNNESS